MPAAVAVFPVSLRWFLFWLLPPAPVPLRFLASTASDDACPTCRPAEEEEEEEEEEEDDDEEEEDDDEEEEDDDEDDEDEDEAPERRRGGHAPRGCPVGGYAFIDVDGHVGDLNERVGVGKLG